MSDLFEIMVRNAHGQIVPIRVVEIVSIDGHPYSGRCGGVDDEEIVAAIADLQLRLARIEGQISG